MDRWSKLIRTLKSGMERTLPSSASRSRRTVPDPSQPGGDRTIPVDPNDRTMPVASQPLGDRTVPVPSQALPDRTIPVPSQALPDRTVPVPSQAATVPVGAGGPQTMPVASRPPGSLEPITNDFELWCARVSRGIMESLHARVMEQARAFEQHTGQQVEVVYPAQRPSNLAHAASEMLFMKLGLGSREIHIYSARNPGKPPILHMISPTEQLNPTVSARGAKAAHGDIRDLVKHRLASQPICRVAIPRNGIGFTLVEPGAPQQRVKLEDVVYRVFQELARRRGRR